MFLLYNMQFFKKTLPLIFFLAIKTAPCLGDKSSVIIKPVYFSVSKNNAPLIGYNKPCGSQFLGFALNTLGNDGVEIGAVLRNQIKGCAGISHFDSNEFSSFDYRKFKYVRSMPPQKNKGVPVFAKITDYAVNITGEGGVIRIIHRDRCRHPAGFFIKPGEEIGHISVGFLEMNDTASRVGPGCHGRYLKEEIIRGIKLTPEVQLSLFQFKPKNLEKEYVLKLVSIEESSIENRDGRISFTYGRKCNEAPVGMVTRQKKTGKRTNIEIGMVVARFYNLKCPPSGFRNITSHYKSPNYMRFQRNDLINAILLPHDISDLSIAYPGEFQEKNEDNGKIRVAKIYKGCDRNIGIVFSSNPLNEKPLIGLLRERTSETSLCTDLLKQQSLKIPYIYDKISLANMKPLILADI
ncbi:MAG: hypothetical protein HQK54_00735 [Oligoflexales bacterium]|nr:hypothetical protein [Oligoflexales bacterium]